MNYLGHLSLAGDQPLDMVANLMGDFVRGPVDERVDARLRDGIRLHRLVDSFTDSHPAFVRSRLRLSARHRRVSALIMDVYYDHLLARNWHLYSDESLQAFAGRVAVALAAHRELMPPLMQHRVAGMIEGQLLLAYRDRATTVSVLRALERRFRRPIALVDAATDLGRLDSTLEQDFHQFFPAVRAFVAAQRFNPNPAPAADDSETEHERSSTRSR